MALQTQLWQRTYQNSEWHSGCASRSSRTVCWTGTRWQGRSWQCSLSSAAGPSSACASCPWWCHSPWCFAGPAPCWSLLPAPSGGWVRTWEGSLRWRCTWAVPPRCCCCCCAQPWASSPDGLAQGSWDPAITQREERSLILFNTHAVRL